MNGPPRRIVAPEDDRAVVAQTIVAAIAAVFFIVLLANTRKTLRGETDDRDPQRDTADPIWRRGSIVDPAYSVAAGSLDLGGESDERFSHEVVDRRGEDLVVEVTDDVRTGRFLVRLTGTGERLVSPANSFDRRHDEAWTDDVEEYLQATRSLPDPEIARE